MTTALKIEDQHSVEPTLPLADQQRLDRERVADRLLKSSSKNSYDPAIEIDWDAPTVPGLAYMPLHRTSLYGTALWEQMSVEQRVELSKHEIVSVARVGLWFEVLLMQMLAAHVFDADPATKHAQYALTEIGDETRHSVMFARFADRFGGTGYHPNRITHRLAKVFKTLAINGPALWAGTLIAEELLDRLQREAMNDESIQPLCRMINRIHVVEEARHVRFAREELKRSVANCGPLKRQWHAFLAAQAGAEICKALIHPDVYVAVGLNKRKAKKAVRKNANYHETRKWLGSKVMPVLEEVGMLTPAARMVYRQAHLI